MSLNHKDHLAYARDIAPRLAQHIASQRDAAFENAVGEAFSLYSFVIEDFRRKTTKNLPIFDNTGVMLIEMLDVFRGLLHGHAILSPVVIAALTRVALEIRINLQFIFSRAAPSQAADRYRRYGQISTLAHDSAKPASERRLGVERVEQILRECPEFVRRKPDGSLKFTFNWTGDRTFDSLKKLSAEVGLASDYETTYSATSEYVHGTYLMMNAYSGPDGIGPVGTPRSCKTLTFIGVNHCMRSLRAAVEFYGVPVDREVLVRVQYGLTDACRDVLPGQAF